MLQTAVDACAEAMVPELVDVARLTDANGALALSTRVFYQFAGPVVAGGLLPVGPAVPFAVSGVACLAATGILLRGRWVPGSSAPVPSPAIPSPATPSTPVPSTPVPSGSGLPEEPAVRRPRPRLLTGLRLTLGNRALATVVLVGGITTVANNAFLTGFVLYANAPGPLGLSPPQYGLLLSAVGVGAGAGSVLTGRLERHAGRRAVMWLTRLGWASTMAAPLVLEGIPLGVALAVGSALGGMFGVQAMRIRQRSVPPEQRGQVFAASRMLSYGAAPLGATIGGLALTRMDTRTLFAVCAAVTLATAVPLARWIGDEQPTLTPAA